MDLQKFYNFCYSLVGDIQDTYIYLAALGGLLLLLAILCIRNTLYPRLPSSVKDSVRICSNKRKNKYLENIQKMYRKELTERERKYINTVYRRLGYSNTAVTFENDVNKQIKNINRNIILLTIIASIGVFFISKELVVLIVPLGLGLLFITPNIAKQAVFSNLNAKISQLNRYQMLEYDILINRFMSILDRASIYGLSNVLASAQHVMTSVNTDIDILLVDLNIESQRKALDNYRDNIVETAGSSGNDVVRFIEKLKKLYIQGDTHGLHLELFQLRDKIQEDYFKKYINSQISQRNKKAMNNIMLTIGALALIIIVPLMVFAGMETVKLFMEN